MSESTGPDEPQDEAGRPTGQDPYVERLRPDPSEPPQRVIVHSGLLGNSDRPGYHRLYFNRALNHYAEFKTEDVVYTEPIPPEQPPFLGEQATRVTLKRDATIDYTRSRRARPLDEFDLDVRLGRSLRMARAADEDEFTEGPRCEPPDIEPATDFTCMGKCVPETSPTWCGLPGSTCLEVCEATPFFCRTQHGATCGTCQGNTCQTCWTCQATCQGCGGGATERTCESCVGGGRVCP
jgi:hypothetical protein